jgi:hypothetical protein
MAFIAGASNCEAADPTSMRPSGRVTRITHTAEF